MDLRGNPGGLLHEAIKTVEIFVGKGQTVLESRAKISEWTDTYKTINPPVDKDIEIVFLVDGGSASASEIVSGVMQDFDRAVVLGRRSYGKGLVQVTRKLKYNTSIKVTKAKYYLPSGRCIQAIDYANRDDKGKAIKTPDSLLAKFKTRNGRAVLDASGITPDVKVEREKLGPVTRALSANNVIFNYATEYVLNHDSIAPANEFKLTAQEVDSFVSYINKTDYDFDTKTDKGLEYLEKKAEKEDVLDDIQKELDAIKEKVQAKKKAQINDYRAQIKKLLEVEIATRYYLQEGKIQNKLSGDADVEEALKLLKDKNRYHSILSGESK